MLNAEQIFRLGALAALSIVFVAVLAIAEKEESKDHSNESIMSKISLIDEAELINNGGLNAYKLTQIGNSKDTAEEKTK